MQGKGNRPLLAVKDLHKSFGKLKILFGLNLSISKGERLIIVGPSGGGKSTLLRCIIGLEEIDKGEIRYEGETYISALDKKNRQKAYVNKKYRMKIGMVFQHFNLFPHLSVLQNLCLAPTKVRHMNPKEAKEKAFSLLKKVGLEDKANEYPARLSGGQRQRVAITRALLMEPELMLFDEVTSALDPELIKEVLDLMVLLAEQGMAMVVVTHEMGFARDVGNRILFMKAGKIHEEGPPEVILSNPAKKETRQFLSNFL